jgi:type I restriction enzyme S subunit
VSAELLLRAFDRAAQMPDGVGRLRGFVLDLAVRGRLSGAAPSDQPSTDLIEQIRVDGGRSFGSKWLAKSNRLSEQLSSPPFALPTHWTWVRFGGLHDLVRGVTYTRSDVSERPTPDYLPILRANNIRTSVNFDDLVFVRRERVAEEQRPRRGDYLVALSSGSKNLVGKTAHVTGDFDGGIGGFCGILRLPSPSLEPFVGVYLASSLYRDAISEGSRGIGINNLQRSTLDNLPFPLPPLAEQHRIVAQVDELMALCDQLEAAQAERENCRDALRSASLHRLTATHGGGSIGKSEVRFFLQQSPRLVTKAEHVAAVRRTILDLAIRGRLVPQDPDDEPASALLRRTASRSDRRRSVPPAETVIDQPSVPFEMPLGWESTFFGRLIAASEAGWSPKTESFPRTGQEWAVLKVSAVSWDSFRPTENKQLLPGVLPRREAQVRTGDFLISRANTSELVAKAVAVDDAPPNLMLSDKIVRLSLVEDSVPRFLLLVNNHAKYAREYYVREASGASPSMKNVSRGVIYNLPIPLPPLAEQHRIVAKVDELMAVCDDLERALTTAQAERAGLLEALLHEALDGSGAAMPALA